MIDCNIGFVKIIIFSVLLFEAMRRLTELYEKRNIYLMIEETLSPVQVAA